MSILNGIKEDVYMTAERMISVVEEGAALIMGTTEDTTGNEPFEHSDKDIFDDGWEAEADNIDNPLNGITESVLGDIMKNQVCENFVLWLWLDPICVIANDFLLTFIQQTGGSAINVG